MLDHDKKIHCRESIIKKNFFLKSEVGICGITHTLMSPGTVLKLDAFHLPRQWTHGQIYHNKKAILITERPLNGINTKNSREKNYPNMSARRCTRRRSYGFIGSSSMTPSRLQFNNTILINLAIVRKLSIFKSSRRLFY